MARVTVVKKAQQRYEQVPVIDPETGQQKKVPVMGRDGKQKTSKRGPQWMRLTVEDRTKPKPNLRCDFPGCAVDPKPGEIVPGQSYKWIKPKSGPYGGSQKNRHNEHPSWQVWEYSSSMSARLAQIAHDFWNEVDQAKSEDDIQSALDTAAESIKELAEEKREGASNIEEGFGHETEKSTELAEIAESLESWADEVSSQDIPELATDEIDCDNEDFHNEDRDWDEDDECPTCGGGVRDPQQYTPDEPTDDQISDWLDQVRDQLTQIDEPPV